MLARVPKGHQDVVAAALRTVFVHPNPEEIAAAWDRTADMFARQFPKVKELTEHPPVEWTPDPGCGLEGSPSWDSIAGGSRRSSSVTR